MILDKEGELTTGWRTVSTSSANGALSYLEASKLLVNLQNSINGMRNSCVVRNRLLTVGQQTAQFLNTLSYICVNT